MISCRLIHVTRNPKGLQVSKEVRLAGEALELGRGPACRIHLPDHRVGLLHATIGRADDGTLQIEAAGDALISIDGFVGRAAALRPGMQVGIGPYQLALEPAAGDVDLVVTVDMPLPPTEDSGVVQPAPVTLAALGISKRRWSLGLAAVILLAFLLLPMLPRVSPAVDDWQAKLPLTLTGSWDPGPLSTGHGALEAKCSVCHQQAFRGVADTACTKCHERIAMHLAADAQHGSVLGTKRCADCHPAHQGKAATVKHGASPCVGCHKHLDAAVAKTHDFGADHPPFHLTVVVGKKLVRVRQDAKEMPAEQSGLKFSHQFHLDKKGISTPDGDTVLTCRDCHKLEESGIHFAPMAMDKTCQQSRCHKLRFTEPVHGVVPHGPEREVMNRLRAFYANQLADAPAGSAKECAALAKTGSSVRHALDCAAELARRNAASSLFREEGENLECALCHEIAATENRDVPWKVAPVRINRDWQPKAVFSHARHDTVACVDCHDKTNSKTSEDIAFPRIEKCRECHSGAGGAAGKVKSGCDSCHRFHRVAKTPS